MFCKKQGKQIKKISASELAKERNISPKQIEDFKNVFNMFDKEHKGKISLDELKKDLEEIGMNTNQNVEKILRNMDSNEDNQIDFVFVTNNSSHDIDFYVNKMNRMGVKCDRNNFYTSIKSNTKKFPNIISEIV